MGKGLDQTLRFREAAGFLVGVLARVAGEGILKMGKGGLGPVEGRDVKLVDRLATRGGEGAKETAVKGGAETED